MPERRKNKRIRKRIQVEYGVDDLDTRALIIDISVGGMFIKCRRPLDLGTRIHLHILDSEGDFYAEGVVVRQRQVEPRYRMLEDQGMGVRFLQPAELVREVIPRKKRRQETNTLVCESRAEVDKVLEQVTSGFLLVPGADPPPSTGTVVEFTIRLELDTTTTFQGQGRVVQILNTSGEGPQIVVEAQDKATLKAEIEAALR